MGQFSHSRTYKLVIALIVVLLLQLIPFIGFVLHVFGVSYLSSFLIIFIMVSLFFEAKANKVHRELILVPILGIAAYYALVLHQNWIITNLETKLQLSNSLKTHAFNPEKEDLVTEDAGDLVDTYHIPVAFEKSGKVLYGYLSHRMLTSSNCHSITGHKTTSFIRIRGIKFGAKKSRWSHSRPTREGLCHLSLPERPIKDTLLVKAPADQIFKRTASINVRVHSLVKNNLTLAEYRTASVYRYSLFPLLYVGCSFTGRKSSRGCFFQFKKDHYQLRTNPINLSQRITVSPAAMMLGLKKYEDIDFANFVDFRENLLAISQLQKTASNP